VIFEPTFLPLADNIACKIVLDLVFYFVFLFIFEAQNILQSFLFCFRACFCCIVFHVELLVPLELAQNRVACIEWKQIQDFLVDKPDFNFGRIRDD
jgi:hypothetical protein